MLPFRFVELTRVFFSFDKWTEIIHYLLRQRKRIYIPTLFLSYTPLRMEKRDLYSCKCTSACIVKKRQLE